MTKEEAKQLICAEWEKWEERPDPSSGNEMFNFFLWLQDNRPDLLKFRSSGDPWQVIHGWLEWHERSAGRTVRG